MAVTITRYRIRVDLFLNSFLNEAESRFAFGSYGSATAVLPPKSPME